MWNLNKKYKPTYLQNRHRLTNIENKLTVTKGYRGGGINWEIGMDIYTLLYIKEVNNKDLLYSTGNYTQYLVVTYNGKEYIYIYITESLRCTPETNTTL